MLTGRKEKFGQCPASGTNPQVFRVQAEGAPGGMRPTSDGWFRAGAMAGVEVAGRKQSVPRKPYGRICCLSLPGSGIASARV